MEALSQLFTTLKTTIILFIKILLIKLLVEVNFLITTVTGSRQRVLTATQFLSYIEEKHPAIRYTRTFVRLPESPECAVCLTEFTEGESVRNLKCRHLFHKDCLDRWLQECRRTCPLCRRKVLPDEVVASYRRVKDDQVEYDSVRRGDDEEMVFLLSRGSGFLVSYFSNDEIDLWA